jgi:hypothetical protein
MSSSKDADIAAADKEAKTLADICEALVVAWHHDARVLGVIGVRTA